MKTIKVKIRGTTPLLMHKMSPEAQAQLMERSKKVTREFKPEVEAEQSAYRIASGKSRGQLCIPARIMKSALVNASSWYKVGKKSMKQFISGATRIEPYEIPLGTKKYEIDLRPVVIQRGSRVMRARPRVDKWSAEFKILYDERWISDPKVLREVLTECGVRIGIMDNRPQRGGENGTFEVVSFKRAK